MSKSHATFQKGICPSCMQCFFNTFKINIIFIIEYLNKYIGIYITYVGIYIYKYTYRKGSIDMYDTIEYDSRRR